MKKIFLLFLLFFTTDSFASGIASNTNSAPCTNNTLETYSGNTNLQADWQPNEIQLRWYDNNTLLDVQSSANTCTYDGTLTIPQTAPTRTGYTFDGWTVRPEYDFSTLPTNEAGNERYGKGKTGYLICYKQSLLGKYEGSNCRTEDFIGEFNDLDTGEWKVIFSWGKIYGMSMCSSTTGTLGTTGTPTETSNGLYCWCRATGYVPNGNGTRYAPTSVNWVFNSNCEASNGSNICRSVCAGRCASNIADYYNSNFIRALFQSGGQ